jgi:hypothetical protein
MKGVLAWQTLGSTVPLDIALTVDDHPVQLTPTEVEHHHIALHEHVGEGWDRAVVEATLELPANAAELLQRSLVDVTTTAIVSCRPCNLRGGWPLSSPGPSTAVRSGRFELWREQVSGRVDLTVDLTISSGGSAGRLLGGSRVWTIAVDEPSSAPGSSKSPFRVEWVNFAEDLRLAAFAGSPSYLDLQGGADPVMFLNTAVPNLRALLSWERARTTTRDVRDLVGTSIAMDAWLVLAAEAVEQVSELEDGPALPGIAVLDNVLTVLASHLPSISTVGELLERIVADRHEGAGDQLRSEVAAVVAQLCQRAEVIGRAATRVIDG